MGVVGNWEEGQHLSPDNFGQWIAIPGSPLEARINTHDPYPSIRLRWNPVTAMQWFLEMLEEVEAGRRYWSEENFD